MVSYVGAIYAVCLVVVAHDPTNSVNSPQQTTRRMRRPRRGIEFLCNGFVRLSTSPQARQLTRTNGHNVRAHGLRGPLYESVLLHELPHEIQHVLAVQPEHAARPTARAVEPERRHARDHVAAPQIIGAPRITEAGAARRRVVRQQQ